MCQQLNEPVSKFAAKILKLVRKAYLQPAFNEDQHREIAKNHFLKGMLPTIADSFAAVDPDITFEDALVRARRVEARKNLLTPANPIKTAPKVASSSIPVSSLYSLLGIPPAAALQSTS